MNTILEFNTTLAEVKNKRKIVIYDFDHTLVKPKQGRTFPKNAEDWTWLYSGAPDIIRRNAKKYLTVILTDQSKPWKIDMIRAVLSEFTEPIIAIIAMEKASKKPNPDLFLSVFPNYSKTKSWMVGDAAGRPGDWSANDRDVAKALEIKFYTPEEIFAAAPKATPTARLVFMIGAPGAGKSTYIKNKLSGNYAVIDGDLYKTSAAMLKQARFAFTSGSERVVLDATHGSRKRREAIVVLAKELNLGAPLGIWLKTDKQTAIARNAMRDNPIPNIAIYTFFKNFEEPDPENEGYILAD